MQMDTLLAHLTSCTSTMWKEVLLYVQLHVSLLSNKDSYPHEGQIIVSELRYNSHDVTRRPTFFLSLLCVPRRPLNFCFSGRLRHVVDIFWRRPKLRPRVGGASGRGKGLYPEAPPPSLGAEAKASSSHKELKNIMCNRLCSI